MKVMRATKGPRLWVALDGLTTKQSETIAKANQLHKEVEGDYGFKINLDFVLQSGIEEAIALLPRRPIFVDLKMWNGARTMAQVFCDLNHAGVFATNAYAFAGDELAKAIRVFREKTQGRSALRIYAVTILTHYNDVYTMRLWVKILRELVPELVSEGIKAGADGVIVPGTTLRVLGPEVCKIMPGLRPAWYHRDDRHEQEYTPEDIVGRLDVEAVCGGPIMNNDDPVAALRRILREIE